VDNVPTTAEEFARINPADIENVSVLKDAAAAAIYGARAAYGVVLVTTRTAKSGKLEVGADLNYGTRQVYGTPKYLTDPYDFIYISTVSGMPLRILFSETEQAYAKRRSEDPSLPEIIAHPDKPGQWAYYSSYDWYNETINQTSPTYTANVRVAQKGERLQYVMSGGYYRQDGMLKQANDIMKRYNFRGNGNYKLTDWWNVGSNISFVHSNYDSPSLLEYELFNRLSGADQIQPPRNPDGTYTSTGSSALGLLIEGGRTLNRVNESLVSFNTTVDILKDVWSVKGDASFRFSNTNRDQAVMPVFYREGPGLPLVTRGMSGNNSFADLQAIENRYTVFNLYTDYHKTFAEKHFVQGLLGYNQEYQYYNYFTTRRMNLISSSLPTAQLATGTVTNGQTINELALRGVFYRLNYIFDNKYIVELDARHDATSRYPSGNRVGFFPSGSAGWVLSREKFMENVNDFLGNVNEKLKIDHLKLRGSYGALGNQVMYATSGATMGNPVYYPYLATMTAQNIRTVVDGAQPLAVYPPGAVAGDLSWEQVRTVNFGLDLALLDNKLELSFERYNRYTEGMLTKSKTLPGPFGTIEPQDNAADLKTSGWELSVGYRDKVMVAGSPLTFGARFMLWDYRSWITKYDNPNRLLSDYYKGQEIGEIWGLTTLGYFQTQEELDGWFDQTKVGSDDTQYMFYVGDLKFANLNGDDEISYGSNTVDDPGDRKVIGNNSIRLPYTIDLSGDWRGFDLRLFFSGVGKRDWYPESRYRPFYGSLGSQWDNPIEANLDCWTPENRDAYFPRMKQFIAEDFNETLKTGSELSTPQTKYLQDASYLRLKNLTLGYTFPRIWTSKANISNLRIYFSGENLWTPINNLDNKSIDPEAKSNRGEFYPQQRSWSFGLNLSF
jgi:TonB-linked SusC/RagA family outer membrane protein